MKFSKKLLISVIATSIVMLAALLCWIFNPEFKELCKILWWISFWIFIYIYLLVWKVNEMIPYNQLVAEHNKSRWFFDLGGWHSSAIFSIITKIWGDNREKLLKKHFSIIWLLISVGCIVSLILFFSLVWDNFLHVDNIRYIAPAEVGESFPDMLSKSGIGWSYIMLLFLITLIAILLNHFWKKKMTVKEK